MKLQWDTELQWIRQWGDGKAAIRREGFLYKNVFTAKKHLSLIKKETQ